MRTLSGSAACERIVRILSAEAFASRSALGRRICTEFGFRDRRGRPQLAGCLKALRILEARRAGIVLPAPATPPVRARRPAAGVAAVALAETVPARLEQVRQLEIQLVRDTRQGAVRRA